MKSLDKKKLFINFIIVLIIFLTDRLTKLYVLNLAEVSDNVNIYLSPYLNIYLIWNKGIAFGLLTFDQDIIYNSISALISFASFFILILIIKTNDLRVYFYSLILGGALGNLFDRLYYSAVPDFIDLHIQSFHWFVFNVSDIFISFGVICLILVELMFDKNLSNEKK
jgi:signal peptidase II|tara:strand:- start:328 stop:828 length:501 start_codon:yes stop_codon:yes gene_type:complete